MNAFNNNKSDEVAMASEKQECDVEYFSHSHDNSNSNNNNGAAILTTKFGRFKSEMTSKYANQFELQDNQLSTVFLDLKL